ncbi:hypothetical protein AK830_g2728 [Neonectria ditissima]|uniref:Uncharacterized protein n=1 Tax=Neonectria ditissima TaxID=78410 RepID=A0A0P7BJC7_9HYPO|nr:hypothetical protein AK830_g2728 [Neonectria ditissima]
MARLDNHDDSEAEHLFGAIQVRDLAKIERLLTENRLYIHYKDVNGRTPLSWAMEQWFFECVDLQLKSADINVNERDKNGRTPLSWASGDVNHSSHYWTSSRAVERLLQRDDVDLNSKDANGRTPLSWAVLGGKDEVLRLLLCTNGVEINSKDNDGRTALSLAAESGHDRSLQSLIRSPDIDVNSRDNDGRTPLIWAAKSGNVGDLRCLLEHKSVQVNCADKDGRTALSWAATIENRQVLDYLLGMDDIVLNWKDINGQTPLCLAAKLGTRLAVSLLAGHNGVNINCKDNCGRTPLSWAAELGKRDAVLELTSVSSVNINSTDDIGWTPLRWAAEKVHINVMERLIAQDRSTLHLAVQEGSRIAVDVLLSADYNINQRDTRKQTALHVAVRFVRLEMAKILVSRGALVDMKDNQDMTPLMLAVEDYRLKFVDFLLQHGAYTGHIKAFQWFKLYQRSDILCLAERSGQVKYIRCLATHAVVNALDEGAMVSKAKRRLFLFKNSSVWCQSLASATDMALKPYKVQTGHCLSILNRPSEALSFRAGLHMPAEAVTSGQKQFTIPDLGDSRVIWTIVPALNETGWVTVEYFTTLQDSDIPEDGAEFFMQFVVELEATWLKLCGKAEDHLSNCRLDQLKEKGQSSELIYRLAKDALKWTELRVMLKDHVQSTEQLAVTYCRQYNGGHGLKGIQQALAELEQKVNNRLSKLDQTVRDLLQLEFAWVSITEAHKSTSIATSMKRLSWITRAEEDI